MKSGLYLENGQIDATQYKVKVNLLWWQKQGLSYTATGYGRKIPTRWMIEVDGRWYRIYCTIYSNIGSLFICQGGREMSVEYLNPKGV